MKFVNDHYDVVPSFEAVRFVASLATRFIIFGTREDANMYGWFTNGRRWFGVRNDVCQPATITIWQSSIGVGFIILNRCGQLVPSLRTQRLGLAAAFYTSFASWSFYGVNCQHNDQSWWDRWIIRVAWQLLVAKIVSKIDVPEFFVHWLDPYRLAIFVDSQIRKLRKWLTVSASNWDHIRFSIVIFRFPSVQTPATIIFGCSSQCVIFCSTVLSIVELKFEPWPNIFMPF